MHGNMHQIWLHTTALSRGNTKKLHHPWTGPYRVINRLSYSTYRIQLLQTPHKQLVVHFNRLKPCGDALDGSLPTENTSVSGVPALELPVTGTRLDVVEPEDIPAWSKPHQLSPNFPPLPQNQHQHHRLYPAHNRHPLTDLVIWFLSESTKSPGRTLYWGGAMLQSCLTIAHEVT